MHFQLGQLVSTPAALDLLNHHGLNAMKFVLRHMRCDFGDLCDEDKQANLDAIKNGGRIFSSYQITEQDVIWIITEAQDDQGKRQSTCVLLPQDY